MKMKKNSKKIHVYLNRGFSLIEVMIVIVVLSVAVTIAIPLMIGSFGRTHAEVYLDRLKVALELGRITAMSEFVAVFLCPSSDETSCNTAVPENNWGSNHLMLFTSSDGRISDVDRIITKMTPPATGEYISSSNGNKIKFQPNGLSSTLISLRYCATVDNRGINHFNRDIRTNLIGRIKLTTYDHSMPC